MILKKATSREHMEAVRGLWWPRTTDSGKKSADFSCPGCGEWFNLDKWLISDDGVVTPSIDHSWPIKKTDGTEIPSCKFHDHVALEGWVP